MELTEQIKLTLAAEGYKHLRYIEGRGICGIRFFVFTIGLCYGLDETGYAGRYCYPDLCTAITGLEAWSGVDDPKDEYWIKHKSSAREYRNPNKKKIDA